MDRHEADMPARSDAFERFIDQFLNAVCDSSRRRILKYLNRASEQVTEQPERSVGEIAEHMGLAISTTSEHLKQLQRMHLVSARKDGKKTYYQLANYELIATFHNLIISLEGHYHNNVMPPTGA